MWNCRVINPLDSECYVEDTCEEEDTCDEEDTCEEEDTCSPKVSILPPSLLYGECYK